MPNSLVTLGSGEIDIKSGTVKTVFLNGAVNGNVAIKGGTLDLEGTSAVSTLKNLTITDGTLTGPGELDVCGSLVWTGGTMSGSGKTVLCPTDVGTIAPPGGGVVFLDRRWLVNNGSLTWPTGGITGLTGAIVSNFGTFNARSDTGIMDTGSAPELPIFVNHGQLVKDQGGTTRICFLRVNRPGAETVVSSGNLEFCGPWNERENAQEDANQCRLAAEDGGDLAPVDDKWDIWVGASVDCDEEAQFIRIRFFIDKTEIKPFPPPDDWECSNTTRCGPAILSQDVSAVLGNRDCIGWSVSTYIEGGEEPEPVTGVICKPGVEKP